ncbi:MAG: hypothetical protein QOH80_171 [Actinomycetota bacterium]|nr:hypothetical protein [Actinomycetota bacterium]
MTARGCRYRSVNDKGAAVVALVIVVGVALRRTHDRERG